MKLSAPTQPVFLIAVILGVIGILGFFGVIPVAGYACWLVIIAFVLLALGCLLKGL